MPVRKLLLALTTLPLFALGCGGDPAAPELTNEPPGPIQPLEWAWSNPTPVGEHLNDIDANGGGAIAVGDGGAVVARLAGEFQWQAPRPATPGDLHAIAMLTPSRALAAGEDGIALSDDGGLTWRSILPLGSSVQFDDIHGIGDNAAAVGDNLLFVSTDGGETWTPADIPSTEDLEMVAFASQNIAVCQARDGTLFRTTNGGANWSTVGTANLPANVIDIEFASSTTGVAVSSFEWYRTVDGGQSWTEIPRAAANASSPAGAPVIGLSFVTNTFGIIMSAAGQTVETTNAGESWGNLTAIPFNTPAASMVAVSETNWVAVGRSGFLAQTFNAGQNWGTRSRGDTGNWVDIAFADAQSGVAIGRPDENPIAGVYLTSNGGDQWAVVLTPIDDPTAVTFKDATLGILCTFNGEVFRTTDAGVSWADISPPDLPTTTEKFHAVAIFDEQTFFAAGDNATIFKTVDGGASWVPKMFPVSPPGGASPTLPIGRIRAIGFFPGTEVGIALGREGIVRSVDLGEDWQRVSTQTNFEDVGFVSSTVALASTNSDIFRTEDQGVTWTSVFTLSELERSAPLTAAGEVIEFNTVAVRGQRGVAAGPLGVLYESTDGGLKWEARLSATTKTIHAAAFSDDGTAWLAGSNGTILKGTR